MLCPLAKHSHLRNRPHKETCLVPLESPIEPQAPTSYSVVEMGSRLLAPNLHSHHNTRRQLSNSLTPLWRTLYLFSFSPIIFGRGTRGTSMVSAAHHYHHEGRYFLDCPTANWVE